MDQSIQNNHKNIFKIFLVASFMLHLMALVSKAPGLNLAELLEKKEDETVIKLKLVDSQTNKLKQQVVQTEAAENKLKPKDKAFLGKANNWVERETKSATIGTFKEAGIGSKEGVDQQVVKQESQVNKEVLKKLSFSDLAMKSSPVRQNVKKVMQEQAQLTKGLKNGKSKSRGLGQTNDYIEDIPLGDFTKLNTQEFEFYGFYHRIRQKLEQFWGKNIQEQADKIMKSGRTIASDTNHITSLEIYLNSEGEIVNVNINSTSGVRELDNAAIKTFNEAGPFPNPPKGMIKDGRARIKWSFVVNT